MINNLLLSGGQIRGLGYIGILKGLEELDLFSKIKNICGISSGSIFALTYCLEFNSKDLRELVLNLNVDDLKEIYSENIFKIVYNYGLDSGHKFERLIKIVLKKKIGNENCTFKELNTKYPKKKLTIVGSNISKIKTEYFNAENTPDMEIWKAIRISISFPIIFDKVDYNGDIYVDGGLTNNYPIDFFSNDIENTLGISLNSNKSLPNIDDLQSYLVRIIYVLASQKQRECCSKYSDNSIIIDLNTNMTSINFDNKTKNYLIDESYQQFMEKIKTKGIYKKYQNKLIFDEVTNIIENIISNIIQ